LVRERPRRAADEGQPAYDELISAVVARDGGLRTGAGSATFLSWIPRYHKVPFVTDGAINIAPTLEDKVDICQNAIDLLASLDIDRPKVAILVAVEFVTSKMPATIDAASPCKMAERGQITGGVLDGPLAFDKCNQQGGRGDQRHPLRGRR
jgi:phosphotransacetylase